MTKTVQDEINTIVQSHKIKLLSMKLKAMSDQELKNQLLIFNSNTQLRILAIKRENMLYDKLAKLILIKKDLLK